MPGTSGLARSAARAGLTRLTRVWLTLLETAITAGVAWFLAHDVLHHPQPFFAPVAAALALSTSNILRLQRAVQMMLGVSLGIGVGSLVQAALGPGAVSIAAAALLAYGIAVFIGEGYLGRGMMFANQTAVSAILVLALYRSGVSGERLFDALLGGALAIVVAVLVLPANPVHVLWVARADVLGALHGVLSRTAEIAAGHQPAPQDWPLPAVVEVHGHLASLLEARASARRLVRFAPRRRYQRDSVGAAQEQAAQVVLLAASVLTLVRSVGPNGVPQPALAALVDLAAAIELADSDPARAGVHAAAVWHCAAQLRAAAREGRSGREADLADDIAACHDDLQRFIELRQT